MGFRGLNDLEIGPAQSGESWVQSPFFSLSSALTQVSAVITWNARTTSAAASPTPERMFARPCPASSSSSSSVASVGAREGGKVVPSGWVGA